MWQGGEIGRGVGVAGWRNRQGVGVAGGRNRKGVSVAGRWCGRVEK